MARASLMGFVAWRGLAQSPLATGLMILAVAVGVAFQIPNSANLAGYKHEVLRQGVSAGFGDVRVRPLEGRQIRDASQVASQLRVQPHVTAAVPMLTLAGATSAGKGFEEAVIVGLDRDTVQPYVLLRGEPLRENDETGVLIGSALARRIGANVGSEVQVRVFLTFGTDLVEDDPVGRYTMTVRGVAAGGFVAPSAVFMDRAFLSGELGVADAASLISIHVEDHDSARALAARIVTAHPELRAVAWDDDNPFLSAAVKSSTTITLVSYAMVMIAIVIPIWALLYISVLHRQRQIAVMNAIGFSGAQLFAVYLIQAAAIGVIGVALGCLGGFGILRYFDAKPIFAMEAFTVRPAQTLRTYLEPAVIVLAATLVAGVWPAHRASRLEASRILRGGR